MAKKIKVVRKTIRRAPELNALEFFDKLRELKSLQEDTDNSLQESQRYLEEALNYFSDLEVIIEEIDSMVEKVTPFEDSE